MRDARCAWSGSSSSLVLDIDMLQSMLKLGCVTLAGLSRVQPLCKPVAGTAKFGSVSIGSTRSPAV